MAVKRFELILVALFAACWLVTLLAAFGLVETTSRLDLGLYPLYTVAAIAGSIAGHAFVSRSRTASPSVQRRLLLLYLAGPPGLITLLRVMAPAVQQQAAPLVPLWALAVFAIFLIVPLTLRRPPVPRPPAH